MSRVATLSSKRTHAPGSSRSTGFSLVEVMVAVVIICVGLLGIAKMQSMSISNMAISRQRSLAAFEAASLASAMHTNRAYWANAPAGFQVTVNPKATPSIQSSDGALATQAVADVGNQTACQGTAAGLPACPLPLNLAAYDLARWAVSLQGLLPNPTATISCPNVAGANIPTSCTIQINWAENAVASNQALALQQAALVAGNAAQFDSPTYLVYVEP